MISFVKNLPQVWMNTSGPKTNKDAIVLFIKGFVMGIADLIPGVSGGTIAFITGIYSDLLSAISSVNSNVVSLVLKGEITQALKQIHLKFITILLSGILFAIFSLAHLMHYLMTNHQEYMYALFMGLILASTIYLFKEVKQIKKLTNLISLSLGIIFAYVIIGLIPVETPQAYWFIFLCGIIGIVAMILPGISGSFLLLVLGKYEFITGAVKNVFVLENFIILVIFTSGTVTGLLSFSKLLNYFLKRHNEITMSFLLGVLIGSLRKLWPWKEVTLTVEVAGKTKILQEANILPNAFNLEVFFAIALIVGGFLVTFQLEKMNKSKE